MAIAIKPILQFGHPRGVFVEAYCLNDSSERCGERQVDIPHPDN